MQSPSMVRGSDASSAGVVWYALTAEAALERLESAPDGLATDEVARRLERFGRNVLESGRGVSAWRLFLHQFFSPLIYVLLAAVVVTLVIQHWADAIVIGAIVVLNAIIGFTQEYRAENAMQALMRLVTPKATVRRDGRIVTIESSELVPGDVVLVQSGSTVPADLRLLHTARLEIDESPLTGESVPVHKDAHALPADKPLPVADRRNMAFLATSITSGRGTGVVVGTGRYTEVGTIAGEIREAGRVETPLQARMTRFGRLIAIAVLAASALTFGVGLARGEPIVDMFLTAVAIAVAAIPEGLPVVMTIALAVAVRRIAKRNAIVRRLPAVETLGSCDIIVTDKTGTLTENQMTVQEVWAGGNWYEVSGLGLSREGTVKHRGGGTADGPSHDAMRRTLEVGALTNEATIAWESGLVAAQGDPTEIALLVAATKYGISPSELSERYVKIDEIPFEPVQQYAASFHRAGEEEHVFVKGAPERVLRMCASWMTPDGPVALDGEAQARIGDAAGLMGKGGLRVLAMASGVLTRGAARGEPKDLVFQGLQGMLDPPRAEATAAMKACRGAGIRPIMVTGDHAVTAAAIAEKVGLTRDGSTVLTGAALQEMDDAALKRALLDVAVVARASPTDKLRIVRALREQGHVVAVTGDGVNDAPALKSAHLGAAMGRSGTDVAKEASDIVLTDDNFATVYNAVEEGRFAFANIRNATFFLVSSGVGFLIAILTVLFLGLPLPFLPTQILWLNLVTNGVEDVALAFEPGDKRLVTRPPRKLAEGILSRLLIERSVLVGALMAAGTLGVFQWAQDSGQSIEAARTAALTTMVLFQVFHVGNCRSESRSAFAINPLRNRFLFIGTTVSLALHVFAVHAFPFQLLLHLEPLTSETWLVMVGVAATIVPVVEAHKLLRR